MSKIPGFQAKSKLRTPGFKSRLVAPGSFSSTTATTLTSGPPSAGFVPRLKEVEFRAPNPPSVAQSPPARQIQNSETEQASQFKKEGSRSPSIPGPTSKAPSSVATATDVSKTNQGGTSKQEHADRSVPKPSFNSKIRPKATKDVDSKLVLGKRGPHLPQPRSAVSSGKNTNLHNKSPYSRDNEPPSETVTKRQSARSQSPSKSTTSESKESNKKPTVSHPTSELPKQSNSGIHFAVPEPNQKIRTFSSSSQQSNSSVQKKHSNLPAPGQLTKKSSTSLHNLSVYPRRQGSNLGQPNFTSKLSSSKSMQNLSPRHIKERINSDSSQPSQLRKFASVEDCAGKFKKERPNSINGNLLHQKLNSKSQEGSLDSIGERYGLRKPNTLRIPVARPSGKSLVPPKSSVAKFGASLSQKESHCSDVAADQKPENYSGLHESSALYECDQHVDMEVSTPKKTKAREAIEKNGGSVQTVCNGVPSASARPLQSTPLRKEAGHMFPFQTSDSEGKKDPFILPVSPMKSVNSGKSVFCKAEDSTREAVTPKERSSLRKLDQTFEINVTDMPEGINESGIEETPLESRTFTCEENEQNSTYTQITNTQNQSALYQIVYGLQDDDDDKLSTPHDSTFTHGTKIINGDNGNVSQKEKDAPILTGMSESQFSDVEEKKEVNITDEDINACNFNLYDVTPPHVDVSAASVGVSVDDEDSFNLSLCAGGKSDLQQNVNSTNCDQVAETEKLLGKASRSLCFEEKPRVSEKTTTNTSLPITISTDFTREMESLDSVKDGKLKENSAVEETEFLTELKTEEVFPVVTSPTVVGTPAAVDKELKTIVPDVSGNPLDHTLEYDIDIEIDEKQKCMTLPLVRNRRNLSRSVLGLSPSARIRDMQGRRLNESLSSGLVLKPPSRNLFILEDDIGNVTLDKWSYIQLQHEIKAMKTALLKLKRNLQEVDVHSPLSKNSTSKSQNLFRQHSTSSTVSRPFLRPKAYSDINNWCSRSLDFSKFVALDGLENESLAGEDSEILNKTLGERKDILEQLENLEKMKNDLVQELETKDSTIHLLQTQLEGNQFMEERDELLEQNIILREEVHRLTEELQAVNGNHNEETQSRDRIGSTSSIKDGFAKQLDKTSKVKVGMLKRMYSYDQDNKDQPDHSFLE